jgi:hypothetical protein
MKLGVQDGRLLPESPFNFQGDDFAFLIWEGDGEFLGNPRTHLMPTSGLLIG